jgi:hypothetical protein
VHLEGELASSGEKSALREGVSTFSREKCIERGAKGHAERYALSAWSKCTLIVGTIHPLTGECIAREGWKTNAKRSAALLPSS